jgi:crotonobetainyl-CoA hydratase
VAATLRLARLASDGDEAELWEANAREWAAIVSSADAAEGPIAFAEKRPAVWTGR